MRYESKAFVVNNLLISKPKNNSFKKIPKLLYIINQSHYETNTLFSASYHSKHILWTV